MRLSPPRGSFLRAQTSARQPSLLRPRRINGDRRIVRAARPAAAHTRPAARARRFPRGRKGAGLAAPCRGRQETPRFRPEREPDRVRRRGPLRACRPLLSRSTPANPRCRSRRRSGCLTATAARTITCRPDQPSESPRSGRSWILAFAGSSTATIGSPNAG
jgi:hypothetical protein